jgi:hypothetical protein
MSVLQLIETIKHSKTSKFWPVFLGILYGVALPLGSWFLKNAAEKQDKFMLISDPEYAKKIFWVLTICSVAVSLGKVYSFLQSAYRNWFLSCLACAAFESAFIAVENVYCTAFFFFIVALANITMAIGGFLSESIVVVPKEEASATIEDSPIVEDKPKTGEFGGLPLWRPEGAGEPEPTFSA